MGKSPFIALSLCLACAASCAQGPAVIASSPSPGAAGARWDRKESRYAIEHGARLRIAVDDARWAKAVVSLWNRAHPEAAGAVEAFVSGALDSLSSPACDIALVYSREASRSFADLLPIDPALYRSVQGQAARAFLQSAEAGQGGRFIPVCYEGMAFCWNKTMLDALGFDTTDADSDGLPEAFDSWEEILSLAESWKAARPEYGGAAPREVFPICLDDPWSAYAILSAGGWKLFKEGKALLPGFSSPSFKAGLELIEAASKAPLSPGADGGALPSSACVWRWDAVLDGRSSPFALVGSWMDYGGAEKRGGFDLRFSRMPSWRKARGAPFVRVKGFVVRADSPYPSAAHELLRVLYSKQGMQAMVESASRIPALDAKSGIKPDYPLGNDNLPALAAALSSGHPEPFLPLPRAPERDAMGLYYGIGLNLAIRGLWDGKKSAAEAQAEIAAAAERWLADNDLPRLRPGPEPVAATQ